MKIVIKLFVAACVCFLVLGLFFNQQDPVEPVPEESEAVEPVPFEAHLHREQVLISSGGEQELLVEVPYDGIYQLGLLHDSEALLGLYAFQPRLHPQSKEPLRQEDGSLVMLSTRLVLNRVKLTGNIGSFRKKLEAGYVCVRLQNDSEVDAELLFELRRLTADGNMVRPGSS